MSTKDVLFELFCENTQWVHWLLEELTNEGLHWQPDTQANSIAVNVWHVSRVLDVFLAQHIFNKAYLEEIWYQDGWDKKTGYIPNGIGVHGWGMLTGYTENEVRQIPQFNKDTLKTYFDATTGAVQKYLQEIDDEELMQPAPGYEGKQSNYFWVRHPLFDLTRHVGEMLTLKAMWERSSKESK